MDIDDATAQAETEQAAAKEEKRARRKARKEERIAEIMAENPEMTYDEAKA